MLGPVVVICSGAMAVAANQAHNINNGEVEGH